MRPNSSDSALRGRSLATIVLLVSCAATTGLARSHSNARRTPSRAAELLALLGRMPAPPPLETRTLESTRLPHGTRSKITYRVERANRTFDEPEDWVSAYLLVPDHASGERLPAIVAIHQDGPQSHVGKAEPAGLAGAADQHYGLELFERGYVVICPDRVGHAERRRVVPNDITSVDPARDDELLEHRAGQLLLEGRTFVGKEVYDLMRATDVLCALDYVDSGRIGAIGHSAGGYVLVYFMFADARIKAGASSCGYFDLIRFFDEKAPKRRLAYLAIPGLVGKGRAADYVAFIAPRPLMLTRGLYEWGNDGEWAEYSRLHVQETRDIERVARERYARLGASDRLRTIYFDEDGGYHAFPPGVRASVYRWLDEYLKPGKVAERPISDCTRINHYVGLAGAGPSRISLPLGACQLLRRQAPSTTVLQN